MTASASEAIALIGARMVEFAEKARDSNEEFHRAYALGIARGMAESICHVIVGRHSIVYPELVEAVLQWAQAQRDTGRTALTPPEVRAVRRALSDAINVSAKSRRGVL